jgi:hypothetical protein
MKNVHVLPTDKPSRLFLSKRNHLQFLKDNASLNPNNHYNYFEGTYQNIYITSNEEIKDVRPHRGRWQLEKGHILNQFPNYLTDLSECKLVIMTTDPDLIKDGVQAIDDDFLEWFVKNPSCESVEVEDWYSRFLSCCRSKEECYCNKKRIIIPQEEPKQELPQLGTKELNDLASAYFRGELNDLASAYFGGKPKQETLEEAAKEWVNNRFTKQICGDESYPDIYASKEGIVESHILFAKWQQERMYSEEEVIQFFEKYREDFSIHRNIQVLPSEFKQWFEQFKKK